MDLFIVIGFVLIIGTGVCFIILPVLFTKMIVEAVSFLRYSQKEVYENLRDFAKPVKKVFYFSIIAELMLVFRLIWEWYSSTFNPIHLIPLGIFAAEAILAAVAFSKEQKAAQLYRNLYPPQPTRSAYRNNGTKAAAVKPEPDLPAAAVTSDEDWDKLFGGNNVDSDKQGEVNENLDIAKESDKELLEYVREDSENNSEKADTVNKDLDIRKAPDKGLMQYLEGRDTGTAPTIPAEHKEVGGEELNICPECGYLNFEGNTECDFCGAELKRIK